MAKLCSDTGFLISILTLLTSFGFHLSFFRLARRSFSKAFRSHLFDFFVSHQPIFPLRKRFLAFWGLLFRSISRQVDTFLVELLSYSWDIKNHMINIAANQMLTHLNHLEKASSDDIEVERGFTSHRWLRGRSQRQASKSAPAAVCVCHQPVRWS